ncbi:meiotic recombination protein Rec27 [Schizosaccharomyces pombe]|uniref:Linear element protein rec27 n=1 Tax=Schizosaccharomyces pombe (strain 972 / ATCC 24843) TaxID=284812 RepID=REC27_SCHPO|nr:RecName: Full=Linear element protein rec27; AltName: Full=Meiotic recombination protein rec27; AltName: Full=Meiotically up-regulated gene 41 protein [Schizosaccharomyces pombe 972h-]
MKKRSETLGSDQSSSEIIEHVLEELNLKNIERRVKKYDQIESEYKTNIENEKKAFIKDVSQVQQKIKEFEIQKANQIKQLNEEKLSIEARKQQLEIEIRNQLLQYAEKLRIVVKTPMNQPTNTEV